MYFKNRSALSIFFLGIALTLIIPFINSCGKTDSILPSATNIQMQVLNLSTDLGPVNFFIRTVKRNSTPFRYPISSGYFTMSSIDTPFRVRSAVAFSADTNIFSIDSVLKNNVKYTLFITGLKADKSIRYIFTRDTSSAPASGRGKVRFINASVGNNLFNVTANGTTVFTNQGYRSVSKFVEMPAGNYLFKISNQSSSAVLSELPSVTVQDGKLYTLYCRGIVGRTDTAGFGMAILSNK
jgi:hypothetical protein